MKNEPKMKKNILIVDDSKHFLKALKFLLLENFEDSIDKIFEAENGKIALDLVSKNTIDIVFMDKEMPVMDGEQATKQIVDNYRNVQVIAISFHSEFQDIQKMIEAGARNYIIKEEVNVEQLKQILFEY